MAQYLNLKPVDFDKLSAKRQADVKWEGRILLPKYDGCFVIVLFDDHKMVGIRSRDNKPVLSMDHIQADLRMRYPWLNNNLGRIAFLGEAWMPGVAFKDISGTFRRQRPQPSLGFAPFDLVQWHGLAEAADLFAAAPYRDRLARLHDARPGIVNVFPPLAVDCEGREHAERYARNCKALGGYDGAIASDPDAPYVVSDGKGEFLKVKPLQSFSLQVIGVVQAIGEKTGRDTVALQVRFKGKACGVGTGFDHATGKEWMTNPQDIIGKIVEVQCMDVYPGEDGMMREPRYCGIRDDATADY